MSALSPASRLKIRRSRRRTAHWLMGWAMTLGGLAVAASYMSAMVVDRDVFQSAARELAAEPSMRRYAATQLTDAVIQAGGDPTEARARVDELAASLEPAAVAALLTGLRDVALGAVDIQPATPWATFTPMPLQEFGVDAGTEVLIAPQVTRATWLTQTLPTARLLLMLAAASLTLLSLLVAVERSTPARIGGRWALSTALVAAAVSWIGPWLLGLVDGPWTAVVGALLAASAQALAPFTFALGAVGAGLWAAGFSVSRARSAAIVAATEEGAEAERAARVAPVSPSGPGPLVADQGAAPAPQPYWLRRGHPAIAEPYRESEFTTELPHADQEALAHLTAAAWAHPRSATADAADALALLFEDRGTFHQVALFWSRHAGLPAQTASVVLAYEDFSLYSSVYATELDLPEWSLINRVGQLGLAIREAGVAGTAARLAGVYADLIAVVGSRSRSEADRLEAILSTVLAPAITAVA